MWFTVVAFLLGVTQTVFGVVFLGLDSVKETATHWMLGGGLFMMGGATVSYIRHRFHHPDEVVIEDELMAKHRRRTGLDAPDAPATIVVDRVRLMDAISQLPSLSSRMQLHQDGEVRPVNVGVALGLVVTSGFFIFLSTFLVEEDDLRPFGIMLGSAAGLMILYAAWRALGGSVRFKRRRRAGLTWTRQRPVVEAFAVCCASGEYARLGRTSLTLPDLLEVHDLSFLRLIDCVLTSELEPILAHLTTRDSMQRRTVFSVLYRRVALPAERRAGLAALVAFPHRSHLKPLGRVRDAAQQASVRGEIRDAMDEIRRRLTQSVGAVSLSTESERGSVSLAREGKGLALVEDEG